MLKKKMKREKQTRKLDIVKEILINNHGKSILDIGCARGLFSNEIDKTKYWGVDINNSFLSEGKKKGLNLKKVDLNRQKLPLKIIHLKLF